MNVGPKPTNGKTAFTPGFFRISSQLDCSVRPPRKNAGAGYSSAAPTSRGTRRSVAGQAQDAECASQPGHGVPASHQTTPFRHPTRATSMPPSGYPRKGMARPRCASAYAEAGERRPPGRARRVHRRACAQRTGASLLAADEAAPPAAAVRKEEGGPRALTVPASVTCAETGHHSSGDGPRTSPGGTSPCRSDATLTLKKSMPVELRAIGTVRAPTTSPSMCRWALQLLTLYVTPVISLHLHSTHGRLPALRDGPAPSRGRPAPRWWRAAGPRLSPAGR